MEAKEFESLEKGQITHIRVYPFALSSSNILGLYNGGYCVIVQPGEVYNYVNANIYWENND